MSSCDCERCEAWRARDREEYRRKAEAIRRGLARLGKAVALWGAMASASKAGIGEVDYGLTWPEWHVSMHEGPQPPWFKKEIK